MRRHIPLGSCGVCVPSIRKCAPLAPHSCLRFDTIDPCRLDILILITVMGHYQILAPLPPDKLSWRYRKREHADRPQSISA
jgi:hypothetical protein